MEGFDDVGTIDLVRTNFQQVFIINKQKFKEKEATKICLKFLRQRGYIGAFNELEKASGVCLEDKKLSLFHSKIVLNIKF